MDQSIGPVVDEAIYDAMLIERPSLVKAIAYLVKHGESPAAIERQMRSRFGNVQMVRNVWHVANYLTAQR